MNRQSYTRGPQGKPLLAMTIGAALDQTVARFADREALLVRHQHLRYSMRELMLAELEQGAS
jgi:fatty-acyl-CoA synthase